MKLLESDGQVIRVLRRDQVVAFDSSLVSTKDRIAGEFTARPMRP
ncbi:hypothetical protein [Paraburkholderia sediminicola]